MEQKLSRREMIRGIAGLVLASPILTGLEAQVVTLIDNGGGEGKIVPPPMAVNPTNPFGVGGNPNKKEKPDVEIFQGKEIGNKTPEDYGIKMNDFVYKGFGLFLCTEILDDPKLKGLERFRGVNKGLKSPKGEWLRNEPIYKKDERFYIVIYNPEGKTINHELKLDLSRTIEKEGTKFINGEPYEVKIRRNKIIEKKLITPEQVDKDLRELKEKNGEDDPFYKVYKMHFDKKMDFLHSTRFELITRKAPFEIKGEHRAFSIERLSTGLYLADFEKYLREDPDSSYPAVHSYFEITE